MKEFQSNRTLLSVQKKREILSLLVEQMKKMGAIEKDRGFSLEIKLPNSEHRLELKKAGSLMSYTGISKQPIEFPFSKVTFVFSNWSYRDYTLISEENNQEFVDDVAFFIDLISLDIFDNTVLPFNIGELIVIEKRLRDSYYKHPTRQRYLHLKQTFNLIQEEYNRWTFKRKSKQKKLNEAYFPLLQLRKQLPHSLHKAREYGIRITNKGKSGSSSINRYYLDVPQLEPHFQRMDPSRWCDNRYAAVRKMIQKIEKFHQEYEIKPDGLYEKFQGTIDGTPYFGMKKVS